MDRRHNDRSSGNPQKWPREVKYLHHSRYRANANRFLQERPRKLISAEEQFYSLNETTKMWNPVSDHAIASEIAKTNPERNLNPDEISKMVRSLHLDEAVKARPGMWLKRPAKPIHSTNIALFKNGLLNLKTKELIPHTGAFFVTGTPAYDFDPDAECPAFMEFLNQVLDESYHPTLQEWMGNLLTTATNHHKLMQLIGASAGGKGTILRLCEGMVGTENTGATSMDSLSDSFGMEGLENVRLITIPEAKDARNNRNSVLVKILNISGGDAVTINRKNKTHLRRPVPGKIMIAANEYLTMLDNHDALKRRSLILRFERSFVGKEDTRLDSKLKAELPGIANWAIAGLERLRREDRFTIGAAGRKASEEMAMAGSPIRRFIRDHVKVTEGKYDYIKTDELFDGYRTWAVERERMPGQYILGRDRFLSGFFATLTGRHVKVGKKSVKNAKGEWESTRGVFGVVWSDNPSAGEFG